MSMGSIRKNELKRKLSEILPFQSPKVDLEQYSTPEEVAAEVLWLAAYTYDDIRQKTVLDLGCGTGIFGIGAALLGAGRVVGVDIDQNAVRIGRANAEKIGVKENIEWLVMKIDSVPGRYDTVIQNPPFGVRKRGADLKFLQKALEVGDVVYSLHKSGAQNREFIKDFVDKNNRRVSAVLENKFTLPRTLDFHRRTKYTVNVDLFRIVRRGRIT